MSAKGVVLPQHGVGREEILDAAAMAEEVGLSSVWFSDHLWGRSDKSRPFMEGWVSLAAVAAATSHIHVGVLVSRVSLRTPKLHSTMAQTVNSISKGRLILGLGIGDSSVAGEQWSYGFESPLLAQRLAQLDVTLEMLRVDAPEIPIWVGGGSDEVLKRASSADGWNYWGTLEGFEARKRQLQEIGGGHPELSWATSRMNHGQITEASRLGAHHVIVATGVGNYRERIHQLGEL